MTGKIATAITSGMMLLGTQPLASADEADRSPNIIFIMLDDMGYGDLKLYGQAHIQMPNVHQMALVSAPSFSICPIRFRMIAGRSLSLSPTPSIRIGRRSKRSMPPC